MDQNAGHGRPERLPHHPGHGAAGGGGGSFIIIIIIIFIYFFHFVLFYARIGVRFNFPPLPYHCARLPSRSHSPQINWARAPFVSATTPLILQHSARSGSTPPIDFAITPSCPGVNGSVCSGAGERVSGVLLRFFMLLLFCLDFSV